MNFNYTKLYLCCMCFWLIIYKYWFPNFSVLYFLNIPMNKLLKNSKIKRTKGGWLMRYKILLLGIIIILTVSSILMSSCKNKWDRTDYLDKIESITIYSVDTESGMNYDKKSYLK
jgi:hypothetical protein